MPQTGIFIFGQAG